MKRVLTAGVLLPLVVALVWWGAGWLLFLGLLPFLWLTLWEYAELAARTDSHPSRVLLYLLGTILSLLAWLRPTQLWGALVAGVLLLLAREIAGREGFSGMQANAASGALGLLYVALPFGLLLHLRAQAAGHKLVLLVLVLTWAGDIAAYYVGRALGRHKLAPRISPGKTVEGAVASLAATLGVGFWLVGTQGWFRSTSLADALALPLVLNAAAQAGDLVESGFKRGAGVKDSSQILPGHGGMLDRIDSLLFAVPALWYYYFFVAFY